MLTGNRSSAVEWEVEVTQAKEQRVKPEAGVISGDRCLTQEQLSLHGRRAATALHDAGVWQGDVVALLMRNDFGIFEASRGASLLGASTVPMNWHLMHDEIAYILDDCDAKVLIAHTDLLTEEVLSVCSGKTVIAVKPEEELIQAYGLTESQTRLPGAVPEWNSYISSYADWSREPRTIAQPMFYTSGTTGRPKGVKRKNVNPEIAAAASKRSGAAFGLNNGPVRSVMTGPLYHSAPYAYAMRVVQGGGLLLLQPKFNPLELLRLIEEYSITHLHMVPTMFVRLLALPEAEKRRYKLDSLQHVCHGAAPCPPDVKKNMIDWWGEVIYEYYAMTETGIITYSSSKEWRDNPGTVGKAVPGVDIRIVDEQGQRCANGTPGEIHISSETTPYVTYHRAAEKTAEMRHGDYVATGDVGYLNESGFLFISDRKTDMVISGGVNIYPVEIEHVLIGMEGIKDCAVFGVPDPQFGERLVVAVETDCDLNAEQIIAYLKERIAGYKVPRDVEFLESFPREDSGKIKKRMLRDDYLKKRQ